MKYKGYEIIGEVRCSHLCEIDDYGELQESKVWNKDHINAIEALRIVDTDGTIIGGDSVNGHRFYYIEEAMEHVDKLSKL